ncbi:MAG: XdhC family protein [Bacteroidales bacterium]|nr:XdhC family protein [Bacteroidales bacterium]
MQTVFSKAEELKNENVPAAFCIVVGTSGSTPRKQGAKMIVYADGAIYGSIGGGSVEKEVAAKAVGLIVSGKREKCVFKLEQDLSMHCGGTMEVYIEPLVPVQQLIIFGAGHIGRALAKLAAEFDFSTTVIDPRENIFQDLSFSHTNCLNLDYFQAIEKIAFTDNAYLVIVTPKHAFDEEILIKVCRKPHAYLGMIGSSRKVELVRKRFLDENILTSEELDHIDMPIGIKFRVETPQEIAVSILARLIDERNSKSNLST